MVEHCLSAPTVDGWFMGDGPKPNAATGSNGHIYGAGRN
jgi:hypothetical protein